MMCPQGCGRALVDVWLPGDGIFTVSLDGCKNKFINFSSSSVMEIKFLLPGISDARALQSGFVFSQIPRQLWEAEL